MKPNLQINSAGFDGQVLGTTLPDLLQLQCLSMASRVVRVDANSVTGRIYFAGGQIVHAAVGVLHGEVALFEMLRWTNGRFTFEEGDAPEETITRHWQSILLEAAQMLDESGQSGVQYPAVVTAPATPMKTLRFADLSADADVLAYAFASPEGEQIESKGPDAENLQAGFAYVHQLLSLLGAGFGAENLREIQLQGKEGKAFCLSMKDGTLAATTSNKANLKTIIEKVA